MWIVFTKHAMTRLKQRTNWGIAEAVFQIMMSTDIYKHANQNLYKVYYKNMCYMIWENGFVVTLFERDESKNSAIIQRTYREKIGLVEWKKIRKKNFVFFHTNRTHAIKEENDPNEVTESLLERSQNFNILDVNYTEDEAEMRHDEF